MREEETKRIRFVGPERRGFFIGLGLVLITLFLYWPTTKYAFVVVDDALYIYENPGVTGGLHLSGIEWAFTSNYAANWHPLTWLTHQADYSLYGIFAGGHHLTNILFHALNTLLLFLLLRRLTGALWASALVAALFGWHPLHVESVAWVAERKDVLSTFFLLLTVLAYAHYVERPILQRYVWVLVVFALGLMAKSMLVTLPCVLLLLDYWPLNRLVRAGESRADAPGRKGWRQLLVEKIPLFVLSAGVCVVTVIAQHSGGAVKSFQAASLFQRLLNALVAYALYLWKTVWPLDLCVFYPRSMATPVPAVILAALVIAGISYGVFRLRASSPWLLVGWLWFLGTLVPVIGLIQVGSQAMADRYTYIPAIGLFIMLAWGLKSTAEAWPSAQRLNCGGIAILLAACVMLTRHQLGYWNDSIHLFTHALAVTGSNAFSENNLGVSLSNAGRNIEAIPHYLTAIREEPDNARAHYNVGIELAALNRLNEAAFHFSEALIYDPRSEKSNNNLGAILIQQGKVDEAIGHFKRAIELNPIYPRPYLNYAAALQSQGRAALAITNYMTALQLDSEWPEALDRLAFLLAACPDPQWHNPAEAIALAKHASGLMGNQSPAYLRTLAMAYAAAGDFTNAVITAQAAQQVAQATKQSALMDKLQKDLAAYQAGKTRPTDWTHPPFSW